MPKAEIQNSIAARLLQELEARQMSQSDLAQLSGVAQKTVNNIVRGAHPARVDILAAIAKCIGHHCLIPDERSTVGADRNIQERAVAANPQEKLLMAAFKACDGESRRALLNLSEVLAARSRGTKN